MASPKKQEIATIHSFHNEPREILYSFYPKKKVYYEQGLQVYDFFPSLYSFLVFKPLPFYQKLNILTLHSQFAIVIFMDDIIVVNMCFPIFFCIFIGRNKLNIFYTISIY